MVEASARPPAARETPVREEGWSRPVSWGRRRLQTRETEVTGSRGPRAVAERLELWRILRQNSTRVELGILTAARGAVAKIQLWRAIDTHSVGISAHSSFAGDNALARRPGSPTRSGTPSIRARETHGSCRRSAAGRPGLPTRRTRRPPGGRRPRTKFATAHASTSPPPPNTNESIRRAPRGVATHAASIPVERNPPHGGFGCGVAIACPFFSTLHWPTNNVGAGRPHDRARRRFANPDRLESINGHIRRSKRRGWGLVVCIRHIGHQAVRH